MHVEDHDPLDRLQEAARRYRNTRTWPRVQAILLAKQGDTAPQIARALGFSRRAVQAWVAAYNRGGLEALPDRPHPGRTPTLPQDQEAASWSGSTPRRAPGTGSASCGAPTSAGSWSRSSPPATPSAGSTSCSTGSATTT